MFWSQLLDQISVFISITVDYFPAMFTSCWTSASSTPTLTALILRTCFRTWHASGVEPFPVISTIMILGFIFPRTPVSEFVFFSRKFLTFNQFKYIYRLGYRQVMNKNRSTINVNWRTQSSLLTTFTSSAKWRSRPCPSSVSSLYRQSYAVCKTCLKRMICKLVWAQDTFVSIRRWLPLLKVAQEI